MSDDFAQRLRSSTCGRECPSCIMASEAADRIEALEKNAHLDHILIEQKRAEIIARGNRISELEAALREIIKARKLNHSVSILRIAELALEGKP